MDKQLLLICALTFIIHLIGTLACSGRIAGSRTQRLALSSILMLLSRPLNSFQRASCLAVEHFQVHRSVTKLLLHAVFKGGLPYLRTSASLPKPANATGLREKSGVSVSIVIATALWTVGASLSTLHRRTVRRGTEPQRARHLQHPVIVHQRRHHHHDGRLHRHVVSGMTDDVIEGKIEESQFRCAVVWLVRTAPA
ncbi:lipid II flippase family protein [Janthinobacterium sp. EB271-G4-3-2]|uniref:lipid II flippase family protein n=1 Tax=Janthinobacterium sp. EB271-G4-3-2 TaxID=2775058 RepID=UPI0022A86988|nr:MULTISPECIES: DUF2837 family protein [unclassified Janthinobacterium]